MDPRDFRLTGRILPVCALALVLAGSAAAQVNQVNQVPRQPRLTASPDSALAATIEQLPGERLLLEDAVARAAVQATGARVAEAQMVAAGQSVRREQGFFDPEIFATGDWAGTDNPAANPLAGAEVVETETSAFEAGARFRLSLGTEITASLNSIGTNNNSAFQALYPEYRSFGALSVRQPLLKGFGPSTTGDLDFARRNYEGASSRYSAAQMAVRAEVETVYWQLYAAERNHAVTRVIRDRAAAFLDDTRLRNSAGMIGPSAVANAEFFLTEAEQAVLDTEEQMDRFSDRLASLTGRRPRAERYRAWDEPPTEFPVVPVDSLVAVAMRLNPDLQALASDAEALRELERGAVWDARPTLDLLGGLGSNGLSGTARDVMFPGSPDPVRVDLDGGRNDALGQVFSGDYPVWNVGFVFAVPLGNREGKGERDRWRAEIVRAEQQLLAAQRSYEEDVRAQFRELDRGTRRLEIATRGVAASIKQVEIGMLEYENGRTTAFEVVRLAADLARAQGSYSDALVRTASAAAALRALTGGWYPGTGNEEN